MYQYKEETVLEQGAEMSETAVDTSTLCLFDVDGTLTAARQVRVFVFVYKTDVPPDFIHTEPDPSVQNPAPRWCCTYSSDNMFCRNIFH